MIREYLLLPIREKGRFARFIVAGVVNTAVHIGIFTLLIKYLPVAYANVLGFLVANFFSFFVASYFVFKVRSRSLRQYACFLMASSLGVVISYCIGLICEQLNLTAIAAPLLTALILPFFSYLLQRFVFIGNIGCKTQTKVD
ncbi:GtrA family protein [Maridesulfovibrio bastinii]|uniref:GtrA family protein n=1 Tax=Maridesulfovibrio bastinii TaxID=47157 RepID=UPI0003F940C8|nr:GtrA family protein [Maridesulfovibrio bastinii]